MEHIPHYNLRPIDGVATPETDALFAKVHEYEDLVLQHRDLLADDWRDRAMALDQAEVRDLLTEGKAVPASRKTVLARWERERPEILARLDLLRNEVARLDRIAMKAQTDGVADAWGPAAEEVQTLADELQAHREALQRTASRLTVALDRATLIKTVATTGVRPRHVQAGMVALDPLDGVLNAFDEMMARRIRPRVERLVKPGNYLVGDTVLFSTAHQVFPRVLDEAGAEALNRNDLSPEVLARLDLPSNDPSLVVVRGA